MTEIEQFELVQLPNQTPALDGKQVLDLVHVTQKSIETQFAFKCFNQCLLWFKRFS